MHHDLLVEPEQSIVYAVNCRVEGSTLHCGALYIEPLVQSQSIRLAYGSASMEVELPSELVDQPTAYCGWQIALPVRHEQVRQPAVLT